MFRRLWLWTRRHAASSAAVAAVVITLGVVGAMTYATPGRVNLNVTPAGATVSIGSRTFTAPGEAVLPAGIYAVLIEAPDHEPEAREIAVERGRVKDLTATLRHHRGLLEADASPAGAEIEVDGVAYGSRIRNLALDTGPHRVKSWAVGCFEQERDVVIRRGDTTRVRLSMDEGVLWSEVDSTMFGSVHPLPDLDGNGAGEFAYVTQASVLIRSGRGSQVLWEIAGSTNRVWTWRLLGRRAVFVTDDTAGLLAWCVELGRPGSHETAWTWRGPSRSWEKAATAIWDYLADGSVIVCGRDGFVHWIDASGREVGSPAELGVQPTEFRPAGDLYGFSGRGRCGALRLGDTRPLWTVAVDGGGTITAVTPTPDFCWVGSETWGRVDGTAHRVVETGRYLEADVKALHVLPVQVNGDSSVDLLVLASDGTFSARSGVDNSVLWRVALGDLGPPDPATNLIQFANGGVFVVLRDGVARIDLRTGRKEWEVRGPIRGSLGADWDGDGVGELFVGIEGEGLRCLAANGRVLWSLRLEHYGCPMAVLPDVDGDGLAEIVLAAFAGWSGVVRGPKVLWRVRETPPLQATPAVVDGRVYVLSHVSGTPRRGRVLCLDAATGSPRWDVEVPASRTRAPAVADWDGDGKVDVAHSGASLSEKEFVLTVLRGRDGAPLFSMREPTEEAVDSYTTPVVADFDGDGVKDFVTSRWHTKDVWCVEGRRGTVLWRHPTGMQNMGALASADLDGDGAPDVVAASVDGKAYALRGKDGFVMWSTPIGANGSRSVPVLDDLTGDRVPDVVLVTVEGRLCVIDGKTGEMLWNTVRAGEGVGRPAVVRTGGKTVILAPMGNGGVVALDWDRKGLLWNGPAERTVIAGPAAADLDGDGNVEVVIGAMKQGVSELVVADALTGKELWRVPTGTKELEADPVIADLDGDGVQDILVATYDGMLQAVSGRGTSGSRRRR